MKPVENDLESTMYNITYTTDELLERKCTVRPTLG